MRKVGKLDSRGKDRLQFQSVNDDPSMTVQSDSHLADLNVIMLGYMQEGQGLLDQVEGEYLDVSEFTDLADALNQAKLAETEFLKLPPKVRGIFNHDVAEWLDTAHDKEKRQALVEAGFLKPTETEETSLSGGGDPAGEEPPAGGLPEGSQPENAPAQ